MPRSNQLSYVASEGAKPYRIPSPAGKWGLPARPGALLAYPRRGLEPWRRQVTDGINVTVHREIMDGRRAQGSRWTSTPLPPRRPRVLAPRDFFAWMQARKVTCRTALHG